jgi:tetratricopeptide (TPR) repeat protein
MKTSPDANYASIFQRPLILSLLIFSLTFFLRIHFLILISNDPTFRMPIIDSMEFDIWAYQITHGQLWWASLQNHPPLYAYFLALIYTLGGFNPVVVAVVQYALFSLATVILFWIVAKLVNRITGGICSFFMATYWFFIYTNSFIFSENLCLFLDLCLVYVLLFFKDDIRKYLLSGLILGASTICRPEISFFLVLIPFWFWAQKLSWKESIKYFLSMTTAALLIIFPVIIYNYKICGAMLLRADIGANVYMGNSSLLKGTNVNVEIGKDWEVFIAQPDIALKRKASESEANHYFINKTKQAILEDPLGWIKLIFAKTFSILTGTEVLRTEDVYVYTYYVLNTPYALISTKMLYLIALVGLVIGLRQYQRLSLIYLMLLTYFPMIFFPVKMRYLVPSIPFTIVFVGIAIQYLFTLISNRKYKTLLIILTAIVLLNFISYFNFLGIQTPNVSETYYAIAKNYAARSQFHKAIGFFQATLKVNPKNQSAYNDLGIVYMNQGEYAQAMQNFKSAMELDPATPYPRLNIEICQKLMTGHS